MKSKKVFKDSEVKPMIRSDRGTRAFVWSVWLVMMLVMMVFIAKYGRNIPLNEDWWLVPPLTGNEPDLVKWLWTQQSEHRIPLPRLILLALLKVTHGDFRAGMFLNAIAFGGLSFFMIRVARHLRCGRTSFTDAFFPIALLHLGHWPNFAWSWMFTFNLPTALICGVLLVLVSHQTLAKPSVAVFVGISLVSLPLCGANGLLFVPILAFWLGYCGVRILHEVKRKGGRRWIGGFLIGSMVFALCLTAFYFVGYKSPSWQPPNPGLGASLGTAIKFLAIGFGPAAKNSWTMSIMAASVLLVPTAVVAIMGVLHNKRHERFRALSVLVFFGNVLIFALAIGWGRASAISGFYSTWPIRYVVLALPALFTAFFIWELYGPTKIRTAVQGALFLGMCILIPFNTIHGLGWRDWFLEKDKSLKQDLLAGTSALVLAERHRKLLLNWIEPRELANYMRMLRESSIGPFAQMGKEQVPDTSSTQGLVFSQEPSHNKIVPNNADSPLVTQEYTYYMPEAGEVYFVWGLNGWQVAPANIRPKGTMIKNKVMQTPMVQIGDVFIVKISVPAGTAIDYCFLITKKRGSFDVTWPVCDGNYREILFNSGAKKIGTNLTLDLVTKEIYYNMPAANKVDFVWGLNGWHVVPEELRPAGTEIKNKVMHTPMLQEGVTFVTKIQVPVGTTINYGFLIKERRGIFNIFYPVWDGDYQEIPSKNNIIEINRTPKLFWHLSKMDLGLYLLFGIALLFCVGVIINRLSNRHM
jgi:hypothetical protein